jgi:hypothetical protein
MGKVVVVIVDEIDADEAKMLYGKDTTIKQVSFGQEIDSLGLLRAFTSVHAQAVMLFKKIR